MARIWCCCGCGVGSSCNSYSTPSLGTSIGRRCSYKKEKKKKKKKVPADWVSGKGPPSCLRMAIFLLYPHIFEREIFYLLFFNVSCVPPPPYCHHHHHHEGPTLITSSNSNDLSNPRLPNSITVEIRASTYEFFRKRIPFLSLYVEFSLCPQALPRYDGRERK